MLRSFLFALILTQAAAAAWNLGDPLPLDPDLRHFRLENGLSVYVRHNAEPENRIGLQLVVAAGSILEDEDQRGLAHFLEHMAFNGTEHFEKQELVAYMEAIGMEFGADVNAYTNFDETVYMLELPADSEEILDRGLWILRDWAGAISLDPAEVEKERGVVLEEWRLRQGAGQRITDRQMPVLFKGSRYPERMPIGEPEVLRNAPAAELASFYGDWYRPDLMAVIAVGDFDVADLEQRIRARFADLTGPADARARDEYEVPILDERNVSVVADPEATQTRISIQVKLPRQPTGTVGSFRQGLVEGLSVQMLNMRFGEIVQKADPPFVFAGAFLGPLMRSGRQFTLATSVDLHSALRGTRAAVIELERAARHGFTQTELERAKAIQLRQAQTEYEERENIDSNRWASEHRAHFLVGDVSLGAADYWSLMQELLAGIRLDEVDAVAPAIWSATNRTITASGPEDAELPTDDQLLGLLDDVGALAIDPYVDQVASGSLLRQLPEAGRIVDERRHPDLGVSEWTLDNGVRVVLKPTDFREDEILVQAISPGGHSLESDADFLDAALASSFSEAGGVGDFDAISLQKFLAGHRVGVRLRVNELSESIQGGAAPDDLELFFQLLHASVVTPRIDAEAAGALQQRHAAALESQSLSPERAFADTLSATLSRYHPRRPLVDAALIRAFDYRHGMSLMRERFADMGDFTFFFVGNFDEAKLRPLVMRYLATLPSLHREERWRDVGVREPGGVVERVVRAGREPKAAVTFVFHGDFPWHERDQRYRFGALSSLLDIRLRNVLREDLGGTYGVRVQGAAERDPVPGYRLQIQFGCDPARVDELVAEMWRSIRALKSDGPSTENVLSVKEQDRRSFEESQRENRWWLGQLVYRAQYGLAFAEILDYLPLVDALEADHLREAANRYLDEAKHVRVTLLPAE